LLVFNPRRVKLPLVWHQLGVQSGKRLPGTHNHKLQLVLLALIISTFT
jgi:hypothetical protein